MSIGKIIDGKAFAAGLSERIAQAVGELGVQLGRDHLAGVSRLVFGLSCH